MKKMFKIIVSAMLIVMVTCMCVTITHAVTYDTEYTRFNELQLTSRVSAERSKVTILSQGYNVNNYQNSARLVGSHTMTYRAMTTPSNYMIKYNVTQNFSSAINTITKSGIYLVDYVEGEHKYKSGSQTLTVDTKAYNE